MRQARGDGRVTAVSEVWQLFSDDENERTRFANLDATLRLPSEPTGPDNRLRKVVKITAGDRAWFLKIFTATQMKNRLRFKLTRPRARDDAERELMMTRALRDGDVNAPRPVAYGRRGKTSYYLCAELPGRTPRFSALL